jgi:curved DNA-binding protein CbpA
VAIETELYELLGIDPDASEGDCYLGVSFLLSFYQLAEIKKAYRKKVRVPLVPFFL